MKKLYKATIELDIYFAEEEGQEDYEYKLRERFADLYNIDTDMMEWFETKPSVSEVPNNTQIPTKWLNEQLEDTIDENGECLTVRKFLLRVFI